MALVECPECQHRVSDRARACPSCGYPVADAIFNCVECGEFVVGDPDQCPSCGLPDPATRVDLKSAMPARVPNPALGLGAGGRTLVRPKPQDWRSPSQRFLDTPTSNVAPVPAPPSAAVQPSTRAPPSSGKTSPLIKAWLISLPLLVGGLGVFPYLSPSIEDFSLLWYTVALEGTAAKILAVVGFIIWVAITVYFLPTLIAFGRRTTNRSSVFLVNLLLPVIGWVISIIMALAGKAESTA